MNWVILFWLKTDMAYHCNVDVCKDLIVIYFRWPT